MALEEIVAADGEDDEVWLDWQHVAVEAFEQVDRCVAANAGVERLHVMPDRGVENASEPAGPTMAAIAVPTDFGVARPKRHDSEGFVAAQPRAPLFHQQRKIIHDWVGG